MEKKAPNKLREDLTPEEKEKALKLIGTLLTAAV